MRAALLAVVGATAASSISLASANTAPTSSTVGVRSEAWYDLPATCTLPTGCVPLPNVLPADTLHVGVIAGVTTSVSALLLDRSNLPPGATLAGGTLALPVDPAVSDLSFMPETAGFKACLLTAPFTAGEGLTTSPPSGDCNVSNPATYEASPTPRFTLDLAPFLVAWSAGSPDDGLLLEPFATAATDHATWQVAFFGSSNATAAATSKITASVDYVISALPASPPPPATPPTSPVSTPDTSTSTTTSDTVRAALPAPGAAAPTPVVAPAGTPTTSSTAGFAGNGYAYPAIWLLPIALIAGCAWIGRLLTKDPKRR